MGNDCMQPLRWLAALVQATAKDTDTVTIAGFTRTVGDLLDEADAALEPQPQAEQQPLPPCACHDHADAVCAEHSPRAEKAGQQGAGDVLPPLPPMGMTIAGNGPDRGHWYSAQQMQDYARSALAARQPVGEPVGTVHNGDLVWLPDAHAPDGSWLYTAPPAAVDLGQLRAELQAIVDDSKSGPRTGRNGCCVECNRWTPLGHPEAHDHHDDCPEQAEWNYRRDWRARIIGCMALLDSKAVRS